MNNQKAIQRNGETLLKHPAGFYVIPSKVVELAAARPTEGFAYCNFYCSRHIEADKYSFSPCTHGWAQVHIASQLDGDEVEFKLSILRSGDLAVNKCRDHPVGEFRYIGVRVHSQGLYERNARLDLGKALHHDYYPRDAVVTPAQLALENLRQRLDGGAL